jgi:hypothetical protein
MRPRNCSGSRGLTGIIVIEFPATIFSNRFALIPVKAGARVIFQGQMAAVGAGLNGIDP